MATSDRSIARIVRMTLYFSIPVPIFPGLRIPAVSIKRIEVSSISINVAHGKAATDFAVSLPRQATRELISTEPDFAGGLPLLLLRVWLALVLGVPGLTVDADAIAAFRVRFTDGALDAGATADALTALDEHLARAFEDSATHQTLRDAALLELAKLAESSATGRDFSLYLREMLVPDDAESARLDAERDAEPDCV